MTKQLEILAQQDARLSLTIDLEPGESLIGRAVRLMVRKFPGDTVVQLVASSTDERLLVTGDRRLQLEIPSSVMAALDVREPVELWTHNIQSWTDEDDKDREAEGVFRVSRATARDTEVEPAPTVAGFVSATVPQTWTADQQQIARTNLGIVETVPPGGGEGVSDHGALTGLADDDHPQYHNDARGDARYSQLGHTHSYEASGAAAAAIAAHEAAANPHPTYTTAAEAAAAAPVQSVAGRTGAVTIAVGDVSGAESTANKAQPSGYASLDSGGKVPQAQLPSIAVTEFLGEVANQSAMLALTGQKGDWCIRTDTGATWIITGTDPTLLGSWTAISYPTSAVTSVAGRTGAVTLSTSDISGLGTAAAANTGDFAAASHTHNASDINAGTLDAARLPSATTAAAGAVELATVAEVEAGTDSARVITPEGYRAATPPYVTWGASTDKTLALADANVDQWCDNGSTARVLTIPTNASVAFSVGTKIPVLRLGSGTCTIDATTGVTLNGVNGGSCTISTRYQGALLTQTGTDAWVVSGDVSTVA